MKKSEIDSILVNLILTFYNAKSFSGKEGLLSAEEFDELVKEAEEIYYKNVLKNEVRGES